MGFDEHYQPFLKALFDLTIPAQVAEDLSFSWDGFGFARPVEVCRRGDAVDFVIHDQDEHVLQEALGFTTSTSELAQGNALGLIFLRSLGDGRLVFRIRRPILINQLLRFSPPVA